RRSPSAERTTSSDSGKRSAERGGYQAPPLEWGASRPLAAARSFAAAGGVLGQASGAGYGVGKGWRRRRRRHPPRGFTVIASHPATSTAQPLPPRHSPAIDSYPSRPVPGSGAGSVPAPGADASGPEIQPGRGHDAGRAAPARAGESRSTDAPVRRCTAGPLAPEGAAAVIVRHPQEEVPHADRPGRRPERGP